MRLSLCECERDRGRQKEREIERESVCVCVCLTVKERERERKNEINLRKEETLLKRENVTEDVRRTLHRQVVTEMTDDPTILHFYSS